MRFLSKVLTLLLFLHLGLILYTNRALYFSKFDEAYWKDKYEHSQWKLPLSIRTLGDDGLYLYEGFRIITGGDPTLLNAEVPPLGKYLIGLSILVFGNGHWYGYLVNITVLALLFLLTKLLLKNTTSALLLTTLVALDPLITSQFSLTMLDSLQLLFLLFTFFLLLHKKFILAGVAFGLFSETKFPILSPPLAILIVFSVKQKKSLIPFFLSAIIAYLLPYARYFALGHSIVDWMRVQKWIAAFYLNSNLTPNVGSLLTALLSGWYQNLFTKAWVHAPEWSPVWTIITPLSLISSIVTLGNVLKGKEKIAWLPIAGFTLFSLIFFAIIPFWVRYLVLPLPFFYLMAAKILHSGSFYIPLLLINLFVSIAILFPTPAQMLTQFGYDWQNEFFHDVYEQVATNNKNLSLQDFRRFGQQVFAAAEIENAAVTFDTTTLSRWKSPQTVPVRITYFTRHLGSFIEEKKVKIVKENGQWKLSWQWNYLLEKLTRDSFVETTVDEARRGRILASDKTPLAEDFPSSIIWATPGAIDKSREEALLKLLWNLFDHTISHVAFHQRIVGNSQPDIPIPLGVLRTPVPDELRNFPGISLTPHFGRRYRQSNIVTVGNVLNTNYFECCSYLYTTTTYDGDNGVEKERNNELKGYNGGTLVIKDARGAVVRTILNVKKQDGKDVQL